MVRLSISTILPLLSGPNMAYKRRILKEAAREYHDIVRYLATVLNSPDAARGFVDEFERQLDLACEMPELHGLSRMKELAVLGYRPMLVKSYIALYKIDGDAIVVAHVFHQSQDYAKLVHRPQP